MSLRARVAELAKIEGIRASQAMARVLIEQLQQQGPQISKVKNVDGIDITLETPSGQEIEGINVSNSYLGAEGYAINLGDYIIG